MLDPSSGFRKGYTNTLKLIEEIEVFDGLAYWLYTGQLKTNSEPVATGKAPHLTPLTLCKIWAFADFHVVSALGNTAIDMHKQQALLWCTPSSTIRYAYEHTKPGSLLHRYVQDSFAKTMSLEGVLSREREDHMDEFLHDVLLTVAKRRATSWTRCSGRY